MDVNFPIPLRPDAVAQLRVPWDLTQEEAEKISRIVLALVHQRPDQLVDATKVMVAE